MKIGLVQIDGRMANLALMKISAFHKTKGDTVEWCNALFEYDKIYASKIFTFSKNNDYLPINTILGGTGYNFDRLPEEIENCFLDYSIYPKINYSIGFTTRGCPNKCSFCIVPQKEGKLKVVGDIYDFWNGNKKIILLDNNLIAAPFGHFKIIIEQIIKENLIVDISQGVDIRNISKEHCELLSKIKLWKQLPIAWDFIQLEEKFITAAELLIKYIKPYKLKCYVLIGFNSTIDEDLYRINKIRAYDISPFVMIYNKKGTKLQKALARWCNRKWLFESCTFKDYLRKMKLYKEIQND